MGTSYETLLVAAAFDAVVDAVAATGPTAIVVPLAEERVAVLPRERIYVAEVEPLAVALSGQLRCPALTSVVFDSNVVFCDVYRDGEWVHGYVSRREMTAEWFEDVDGTFKLRFEGNVYPADWSVPEGPQGDDPAAFVGFAVGPPDLDRIGAALRGDGPTDGKLWAEEQHRAIIEALGLPPGPCTVAYRHTEVGDLPGAVEVLAAPD